MLGAVIGDIVGSRFEWNNYKKKDFEFFNEKCRFTDDTVMSAAVCDTLLKYKNKENLSEYAVKSMQKIGRQHITCGYGKRFLAWLISNNPLPYNSYGNGSAMRVSACGFVADSLQESKFLSNEVTKITHNHSEGIKGAESVAAAVFMAKSGESMENIKKYINENYYYIDFTLDEIRQNYSFDVSCQGSVPQAFEAFFESGNFEDCIRNAVSVGGDSDTIAAIAGGIAEAYYGIPQSLREKAITYLDKDIYNIFMEFEKKYTPKII